MILTSRRLAVLASMTAIAAVSAAFYSHRFNHHTRELERRLQVPSAVPRSGPDFPAPYRPSAADPLPDNGAAVVFFPPRDEAFAQQVVESINSRRLQDLARRVEARIARDGFVPMEESLPR